MLKSKLQPAGKYIIQHISRKSRNLYFFIGHFIVPQHQFDIVSNMLAFSKSQYTVVNSRNRVLLKSNPRAPLLKAAISIGSPAEKPLGTLGSGYLKLRWIYPADLIFAPPFLIPWRHPSCSSNFWNKALGLQWRISIKTGSILPW